MRCHLCSSARKLSPSWLACVGWRFSGYLASWCNVALGLCWECPHLLHLPDLPPGLSCFGARPTLDDAAAAGGDSSTSTTQAHEQQRRQQRLERLVRLVDRAWEEAGMVTADLVRVRPVREVLRESNGWLPAATTHAALDASATAGATLAAQPPPLVAPDGALPPAPQPPGPLLSPLVLDVVEQGLRRAERCLSQAALSQAAADGAAAAAVSLPPSPIHLAASSATSAVLTACEALLDPAAAGSPGPSRSATPFLRAGVAAAVAQAASSDALLLTRQAQREASVQAALSAAMSRSGSVAAGLDAADRQLAAALADASTSHAHTAGVLAAVACLQQAHERASAAAAPGEEEAVEPRQEEEAGRGGSAADVLVAAILRDRESQQQQMVAAAAAAGGEAPPTPSTAPVDPSALLAQLLQADAGPPQPAPEPPEPLSAPPLVASALPAEAWAPASPALAAGGGAGAGSGAALRSPSLASSAGAAAADAAVAPQAPRLAHPASSAALSEVKAAHESGLAGLGVTAVLSHIAPTASAQPEEAHAAAAAAPPLLLPPEVAAAPSLGGGGGEAPSAALPSSAPPAGGGAAAAAPPLAAGKPPPPLLAPGATREEVRAAARSWHIAAASVEGHDLSLPSLDSDVVR